MSNEIWLQRWEDKNIGWHEEGVNPFLEKHFYLLNLKDNATIFIPLCGKTLDISWLLSYGYNVVGCELSDLAITELFEELGVSPKISIVDNFKVYSYKGLTIYEGDFFNLSKELIGNIDAIYDRAALVALSKELRGKYTTHLRELSNNVKQLLVTVLYDQEKHNRTPFSITKEEVEQHYKEFYQIQKVDSVDMVGGLKGKYAAKDEVWYLA